MKKTGAKLPTVPRLPVVPRLGPYGTITPAVADVRITSASDTRVTSNGDTRTTL
jgi:hypothetical protein